MFQLSKSSLIPVKYNSCCMLSRYDSDACLISSSSLNLVLAAQAVVKDTGSELLSRPPYSPDLAHSHFDLFRHWKKLFHDDSEIKQVT